MDTFLRCSGQEMGMYGGLASVQFAMLRKMRIFAWIDQRYINALVDY